MKLGDFFPKEKINYPLLTLNDPAWAKLEGGYHGSVYDASVALKKLETANNATDADVIYQELWDGLHHQGDVGLASYYAVPHLIRIAQGNGIVDFNVLGLVSLIEIQRHQTNNPELPKALIADYNKAIADLAQLAAGILSKDWDLSTTSAALTAVAVAKGQYKLANAIQNLDSEDVIDEFLENY
ncbi:hypothetical protein HQ865_13885 [Mucilaginibacter mali]|uniref:Uncharacterized protein n=1 Tax=Mucilaginibacter mali TaxID=2740462 RepID=A0A7D4TNB2_9SPHI|nr:hypothetical protein [Mucilaginibacter mali]QKJ30793.1 hypothetical protein HQ865_13885 [Mucilaginibacter mali]